MSISEFHKVWDVVHESSIEIDLTQLVFELETFKNDANFLRKYF